MGDNADFLDEFVVKIKKGNNSDDRPLLPELKRLPATIKQIKKKKLPKSQNVRAHFTFVISSGKYKDQYAWGSVPLHEEVTEKADLYKWMCNILGKASLDVDASVRIGDLVGKSVEIMVKNAKVGDKTYQNVTEVLTPENDTEEAPVKAEEPKQTVKEITKEVVEEVQEKKAESDEISEDDLPF